MNPTWLAQLSAQQDPASGAFLSVIHGRGTPQPDCNGFATALVLRALRQRCAAAPDLTAALQPLTQRALDFLETCADPQLPGAFGFWPASTRPAWARRVPADVDDTAIFNLELARGGRRSPAQLQQVVFEALMPHLLTDPDPYGPPWIRPLAFGTWLGDPGGARANPVDCCANANAAALLRECGLAHLPGYAEACASITAGLEWAAQGSPGPPRLARLQALTPYYPDPAEFAQALRHAAACGVSELQPALQHLETLRAGLEVPPPQRGALCGNAYRGPFWHCAALTLAR